MRCRTLSLVILFFASAGPGAPTAGREAISERMLLVLFSGFGTCETVEPLGQLKARLTNDLRKYFPARTLDVVEYCYERMARRSLKRRLPGETSFREESMTPRQALAWLAERAKGYGHVGLVGHSWGGYTALRALQGWERPTFENPYEKGDPEFAKGTHEGWNAGARDALAGKPHRKFNEEGGFASGYDEGYDEAMRYRAKPMVPALTVSAVVTIDPISVPVCNPLTVVQGRVECLSFPPDLDPSAIRARTGKWLNYYQSGGRLHSGSALTGDESQEQLVASTHADIKADPRVLDESAAALLNVFSRP